MKIHLVTPPLTQLNTPYPATAFIKGFLNQFNFEVSQSDLGIEMVLRIFSEQGLQRMFSEIEAAQPELNENTERIWALRSLYLSTISDTIRFLQGKNDELAYRICSREFLPEAGRFATVEDLEWAFGTMGIRDKARFLATLYIEDLGDLLTQTLSPYFAFTRYAEQISRAATSFNELEESLQAPANYTDQLLLEAFHQQLETERPDVVGFSVPFPGNLYGALRCGQYIKQHFPHIKILMGGGYPNTELRSLTDKRIFDYVDFITLDDGEAPIYQLIKHLNNELPITDLKRTYHLNDQAELVFTDSDALPDFTHAEIGTPNYEGLPLNDYLSVIEVANPMHRLWSDGRWNKLTLAHGCYWHRCTFCDTTLDYIKRFNQTTAAQLVDRIETVVAQTGQKAFHFTDEAAPPLLLRDLALELIRRKTNIVWWTNIRFEKTFTADLAQLLADAGCIAVSGGLEVASDRLLKLIKKGTNLKQVAKVTHNLSQVGIMVHAYLMYGFPTQTEQETIDSLEVVRQLFELGLVQSGFWHQFTVTEHSPVGQNPTDFNIKITGPTPEGFANNDLQHNDPKGTQHTRYTSGLNKAIYNFMHDVGFDFPISEWFDFKVPATTMPPRLIEGHLQLDPTGDSQRLKERLIWVGFEPTITETGTKRKQGKEKVDLTLYTKNDSKTIRTTRNTANLLTELIQQTNVNTNTEFTTLANYAENYETQTGQDLLPFLFSKEWLALRSTGLLLIR